MAAPQSPIGSRRRLGAELRRLRHDAGLTLDDVAERMTCSTSKISRLETGKGIPKVPDVSELMRIYGVEDDDERVRLLRLVHEGREHGWWEPLTDGVHPEKFVLDAPGRYAALESDATRVRSFDVTLVFGLLQTEEYAREVLSIALPGHPADEIERLVALRIARQKALFRADPAPLRVEAIVDEAVLHRPVGGPALMARQLRRMRDLADLPNVSVRVLPFAQGMVRAHTGHFVLLEIPPDLGADVVYIESAAGERYLDDDNDIDVYKGVFADVLGRSLPETASQARIDRYADVHAAPRKAAPP